MVSIKGNKTKSMHGMETFVFVHGAWSGAWAWRHVTEYLGRMGHQVIAVDLPGHGEDHADIAQQTAESYAQRVIEVIESLDVQVILVGNSMGGSVISRVAEAIPIRIKKLVYVAAFLLRDGESGNGTDGSGIQPVDWKRESADGKTAQRRKGSIPEGLRPDQVKEAKERECLRTDVESISALSDPVHVTKERFGSIRRFYVHCTKDQDIYPELQVKMLENLPCELVYVMESNHTPHYYMPEELSVILNDIALR